jgi:hypothetical protein
MFMAVDQYGTTLHGLRHPRKDIMNRMSYKSAQKMYVDTTDGRTLHIGYIVGPHWFTVYEVTRMEREDN